MHYTWKNRTNAEKRNKEWTNNKEREEKLKQYKEKRKNAEKRNKEWTPKEEKLNKPEKEDWIINNEKPRETILQRVNIV